MKRFKDISMQADAVTTEPIQENLLRTGAALAYGSKSKGHGDKAVQHLKNSNQKLGSISRKDLSSEDRRLDLLADALAAAKPSTGAIANATGVSSKC